MIRTILLRMSDDRPRRFHVELTTRATLVLLSIIAAFGIAAHVRYNLNLQGVVGFMLAAALTLVVGIALHTLGYALLFRYEKSLVLIGPAWMDSDGEFIYLFDYVIVDKRHRGYISGRDHDGLPTVTLIGSDHGQSYDPSRLTYTSRDSLV